MPELQFIHDYKHCEPRRLSFNRLAQSVFGIDFERFYRLGFWNERYICYSFADGDDVVANVSANPMDLVVAGERKKAVQIGTVMTHPGYRNRGLSASLLRRVLEDYESRTDFIYLFANRSVLDFYPKFGFKPVMESRFELELNESPIRNGGLWKLDATVPGDLVVINRLLAARRPVSRVLGAENAGGIWLWYAVNVFADMIYYEPEADRIWLMQQEEDQLHIYDIVANEAFDFMQVSREIMSKGVRKVVFHFTPDLLNVDAQILPANPDDQLFVRPGLSLTDRPFKYPVIAQA